MVSFGDAVILPDGEKASLDGRKTALQVAYLTWSWLWDLRALGLGSNYSILWSLVSSQVKRRLINLFSNTPCL